VPWGKKVNNGSEWLIVAQEQKGIAHMEDLDVEGENNIKMCSLLYSVLWQWIFQRTYINF
jgi:hypothetical protein